MWPQSGPSVSDWTITFCTRLITLSQALSCSRVDTPSVLVDQRRASFLEVSRFGRKRRLCARRSTCKCLPELRHAASVFRPLLFNTCNLWEEEKEEWVHKIWLWNNHTFWYSVFVPQCLNIIWLVWEIIRIMLTARAPASLVEVLKLSSHHLSCIPCSSLCIDAYLFLLLLFSGL